MDIFAAALPGCPMLGAKHMRALIEAFGTAEDVWKASDKEIVESHLLKGKTEASFLAYRKETEPEEIGEKLYRLQIRCVTWDGGDCRLEESDALWFADGRTDSLRSGRKWSDGGFRRRTGDRQRCA